MQTEYDEIQPLMRHANLHKASDFTKLKFLIPVCTTCTKLPALQLQPALSACCNRLRFESDLFNREVDPVHHEPAVGVLLYPDRWTALLAVWLPAYSNRPYQLAWRAL